MKILFIASIYTGGTGGQAARIAKKMQENGFDVSLMHVPYIPIKKIKNPSFALCGLLKAIANRKEYDVVHAFNVPSALAMKYTKARKKVLSVYGAYSEQIGLLYSDTTAKATGVFETKALKWADKLVTDSKFVSDYYKKRGFDFEVLYGSLDEEAFEGIPETTKKKNQVVYIGRDSFEKGIDILRKIESRINGKVVYCTESEWKDAMLELKASDLLVVPSRMESSPQVIKEALFLKVPVIATNVGGVSELIENDKSGIIVNPNDSEQLLQAINDLLTDEEKSEKIAKAGHDFAIKNLTCKSLMPKYVKFYENLIKS